MKIFAYLIIKHIIVDIVIQRLYYIRGKEVYFSVALQYHIILHSLPYLLIRNKCKYIAFLVEYLAHGMIDCTKSRFRLNH